MLHRGCKGGHIPVVERDGVDLKTDARFVEALHACLDMLDHHSVVALCRGASTRGEGSERDLDIALPRRMHAGRLATSKHQAEETHEHAERNDTAARRNNDARQRIAHQQHKAIGIWPPKLAD